jgi:MFS family permease
MNAEGAAALLVGYSTAGIAGALLLGWLADRIGPPAALGIAALIQVGCWLALARAQVHLLVAVSALLGMTGAPLTALHGAAMARMFGAEGASKAMGISYAIKLPFLFGITPAVGIIYVADGNYTAAFVTVAASLALATALLAIGTLRMNRQRLGAQILAPG